MNDRDGTRRWLALELAEVKTARRMGGIWRPKGFASRRRVKFDDRALCYHVMSRTLNAEFLLGDVEKEAFRRMMWRMASFSGVEVLTYAVMSNHFHILVKVPDRQKWLKRFEGPDGEQRLVDHLAIVYSKKFIIQLKAEIQTFRDQGNEKAVSDLLERFKNRFCDISLFVKELKERFSRWFNKEHARRGTLWMDRFKSVVVDGENALATMAAYIDLNPVRAGIVETPSEYRWSGYGEACGGSRRARRGLSKVLNHPLDLWDAKTSSTYRELLGKDQLSSNQDKERAKKGKSQESMSNSDSKFDQTQIRTQKITGHGEGRVTQRSLRSRVRGFSRGVAMGGEEFVREICLHYQKLLSRKRLREPKGATAASRYFVMRE